MKEWKQIAAGVRVAAVLVIIGLLAFVGYQVHDFYRGTVGNSPVRVTQNYFQALGAGDFVSVYDLTDPESLLTLYGRRATQSEVFGVYEQAVGVSPRQFEQIVVKRLAHRDDRQFVQVELYSPAGNTSRLVLELVRKDGTWLVTHPFGLPR